MGKANVLQFVCSPKMKEQIENYRKKEFNNQINTSAAIRILIESSLIRSATPVIDFCSGKNN